jgi:hypothetical protein
MRYRILVPISYLMRRAAISCTSATTRAGTSSLACGQMRHSDAFPALLHIQLTRMLLATRSSSSVQGLPQPRKSGANGTSRQRTPSQVHGVAASSMLKIRLRRKTARSRTWDWCGVPNRLLWSVCILQENASPVWIAVCHDKHWQTECCVETMQYQANRQGWVSSACIARQCHQWRARIPADL